MHVNPIGERGSGEIRILDLDRAREVGRDGLLIRRIQHLLAVGDRKFLVNLELSDSVDSAGIGELVSAHLLVEKHKGRMVVVNVAARIKRHLQVTGLLSVLRLAETESAGLQILSET